MIPEHIFREYDIRGHEKELDNETSYLIGKAFGTFLVRNGAKTITLARDVRNSSERISNAFKEGVLSTGINVIDIGVTPIAVLYYSIIELKADGGAMITGSHLPKDQNGFKLSASSNAMTLAGDEIKKLYELILKNDFEEGNGSEKKESVLERYMKTIENKINLEREVKVAIDCGNGCASFVSEIFERIGASAELLFCKPDGNFPNHHPDPVKLENMRFVIGAVKKHKLELGIGFDGDADRIGACDEKGNIVWGDYLLGIYAEDLLREVPGAKIVFEVKCSEALREYIESLGGIPIMYKTGHSLIKKKMLEENALLAGEMSGHMFFRHNYYGFDDAIYAACKLIEIISKSDESLNSLVSKMPKYYSTPEIRIACDEKKKWEIVEKAKRYFAGRYKAVTIDGVRAYLQNGWLLVRASNTSAKIIVRAEAKSKKELEKIISILKDRLLEFGVDEKEVEKIKYTKE